MFHDRIISIFSRSLHMCWGYVRAQVDEAADITSGSMNACVVCKILSI